jgi:BlaI family transcriptional regulator, penicillinase repressor
MKKPVPRISDTEWEVMRAVWSGHPATAGEIADRLAQSDPSWHPKTARTLLGRLVEKGALTYTVDGRIFLYRPLVTEQECIAAASTSFLDRVFGGALQPMLAHFVERESLSPEEVRELEQILARRKNRR